MLRPANMPGRALAGEHFGRNIPLARKTYLGHTDLIWGLGMNRLGLSVASLHSFGA